MKPLYPEVKEMSNDGEKNPSARRYTIHIGDYGSHPDAGSYAGSDEWEYHATYPFYGTREEAVDQAKRYVSAFYEDTSPYVAGVTYWLTSPGDCETAVRADEPDEPGADGRAEACTGDLLKRLLTNRLEDYIDSEITPPPFEDYVAQLCQSRGETREHVIRRSGINRTYGHQLFNGIRRPSRDKVIQLAFGFGLNVGEAQQLLKAAQASPLTPRIKRDAVILYCLMHQLCVGEAQKLLAGFDMTALGG